NTASTSVNTEVDISNISTTYLVPSTPNTRIHKDHLLDHVIGDVQFGVQTRRMTKTTSEQGFISVVYKGKTHKDLHTYLFACFLSQEEPKKVWTLVDLPYGKGPLEQNSLRQIVVEGVVQPIGHTSAKQKLAIRNELKARGTLLMALPDKHQLKFNSHKDAKRVMEAIEKRFKGNTETKKVQRTFLKQQFKNFTGSISTAASVFAVCAKMPVSSLPNVDSLSNVMAMLTMRARRFLQKTGRNLGDNRPTFIGFDMSKVECYSCHRKGHFARECRSPKDSRRHGATDPQRRTVPTNEKRGLGYFSLESDYESCSPSSLSNRSQPSGGYHAVPPLITGTFMPPKPNLVFHTAPIVVETDHSAFTVQLSPSKPAQDLSHINRPTAPIIKDWVSDSEDEFKTIAPQIVPSFVQSSEQVQTPRHSV
nr:ribonuclease H-like domain-containing protein [Tanacetum cinerariifolium]